MTVVEYYQDGLGYAVASPRRVSLLRKLVNVVGCVVCLPLYWLVTVHCRWPVTLDLFITVALTELNRLVNEGRRMALREKESMPSPCLEKAELGGGLKQHVVTYERSGTPDPSVDVMAAVVGWREDPDLFRRALESYQGTRCCKFLLVGIDGDEDADQDMVNVFNEVRFFSLSSAMKRGGEGNGIFGLAWLTCQSRRSTRMVPAPSTCPSLWAR